MKYKFAIAFVLTVFFIHIQSCRFGVLGCIRGSGPTITANRNFGSFSGLRLETDAEVKVIADTVTSVSINGQQNIIDNLNLFISGNTLIIRNQHCVFNSNGLTITIHTPNISEIALSGSGTVNYYPDSNAIGQATLNVSGSGNLNILQPIYCGNLDAKVSGSGRIDLSTKSQAFNSKISGSGRITAQGSADKVLIDISGSGRWNGFDLNGKNVTADISGSGQAQVNCSESLDVSISGSGKLIYRNNPRIRSRITGSGSINHD